MKRIVLLSLFLLFVLDLFSQDIVIKGTITCYNRYTLSGVVIKLKKAKQILRSDMAGGFEIRTEKGEVITFEALGFKPYFLKAEKSDTLKINLTFKGREKDVQVAIGNGYVNKDDLLFAVSHLQQENNEYSNYSDIYELFKGRFPGVEVVESASGKTIKIRSINSLTLSGQPLFIVNGIPVSDISYISPVEVKSISILKDGAAAFYGSRGTNGVILIETKK